VGEVCDGPDTCVADALCYDLEGDGVSHCYALCTALSEGVPCGEEFEVCAPLFLPQDVGLCLGDECVPPDLGCDEGERCAVLLGSGFACLDAGTVPIGGNCEVEDCVPGAQCLHEDFGYFCRQLCTSYDECGSGQYCVFQWAEIEGWGVCIDGCNPVTQEGCDPHEGCYYSDPEEGSTLCFDAGSLPEGADCSSMMLCEPGTDCFLEPDTEPFEYYCRAYCDDDHPCTTGTCQTTSYMRGVRICI
jgi:hypothetical protein